jgi:CPA2 family monovalent cation:H+ antiporter-2
MGIAADFVLIVIAGLAGGIVARALRMPLLVGYILAGVFVGPYTAGPTVVQIRDIETLAEIGVALLLFSLGLEVSFRDLRAVQRVALFGGLIQIGVTAGAGALAAERWLGFGRVDAVWFGAMIAVSSTMVVLKLLAAGGVTTTLASRVMIGLLLVQDLAVVPMLIVLPQLGEPENLGERVAWALAQAGGLLAVVFFAGTRVLPPLLRKILRWGSRELFLVAVVATGVGVGAGMHAAGFSFALGAFVAGLILSESEFSHQALSDVVPLRDIFGLLFFVSVGMLFDPGYALAQAGLIGAVVLGTVAGKAVIFGLVARGFGYRYMAPWVIGLGLSQIGEFSFVLAQTGYKARLITKEVYDLALTATVLSIAAAPMVSGLALPMGRAWKRWTGDDPAAAPAIAGIEQPLEGHVVVGGYGRTGKTVAGALRMAGIPFVVVESNYAVIEDLRGEGLAGILGDITRDEILEAAQVRKAKMLLLTMPEQGSVVLAVERARHLHPALEVAARCARSEHLPRLQRMGVAAVQAELEGGLELVRQVLLRGGCGPAEVERIAMETRRGFYSERG